MEIRPGLDIDADRLAEVCRRYGVAQLALFGSALDDDFGPDSDIDLLYVLQPDAIGHGDEATIGSIEALGRIRATKGSYRRYRRTIDRLAGTMDDVVSEQLSAVLGINRAW